MARGCFNDSDCQLERAGQAKIIGAQALERTALATGRHRFFIWIFILRRLRPQVHRLKGTKSIYVGSPESGGKKFITLFFVIYIVRKGMRAYMRNMIEQ